MIETKKIFSYLKKKDIKFFTGVPDSILKDTSIYLEKLNKEKHVVTHNEGGAIALGAGYFLKNKKIPCIYLQNSGLGNTINPLISMAHKNVYSIPMLLIIGWRGAPNQDDEPQHILQGKITKKMLNLMNVDYCILDKNKDLSKLGKLIDIAKKKQKIVACLIKKNVIKKKVNTFLKNTTSISKLKRYQVLDYIISKNTKNLKIFSTTGYTSRELFQLRKEKKSKAKDFYNVGAMGHTSMIALGYSINNKKNKILCLDGDGSLLMHMGSLSVIGENSAKNFKHIVFNNQQHESVGGQRTPLKKSNLKTLCLSCGYKRYFFAKTFKDFKKNYKLFLSSKGPTFFELLISPGSVNNLGRPKNFKDLKKNF